MFLLAARGFGTERAHPIPRVYPLPVSLQSWQSRFSELLQTGIESAVAPVMTIVSPWIALLLGSPDIGHFLRGLVESLATLAVATFAGFLIARMTVAWLSGRERPGPLETLGIALRSWPVGFAAVLAPTIGIGLFAGLCVLLGLTFRLPAPLGATAGGAAMGLAYLLAIPLALLLVGAFVAWPFYIVAAAAERSDILDVQSRAASYVIRRKLLLVALVICGVVLSSVGAILFSMTLRLVDHFARSTMAIGGGGLQPASPFWATLGELLVLGWAFSAFWSWASAVYLVLREAVDGTSATQLDPR